MKITKRQLRRIIRESVLSESRSIMPIIKRSGGKKVKDPGSPLKQYEFPDERTAAKVVWEINDETGREAANSGNIVTVYT
jgi:hypothetical protein